MSGSVDHNADPLTTSGGLVLPDGPASLPSLWPAAPPPEMLRQVDAFVAYKIAHLERKLAEP